MKQSFGLIVLFWLSINCLYGQSQEQQTSDNQIAFSIDANFSPEALDELILRLKNAGIQLELSQTGYCNGYLRILRGEIKGTDGRSMGFETNALRRLTVILEMQKKELGVQSIRLKNRWRKCHQTDDTPETDEAPERQPVIHIHLKQGGNCQKPDA
ncbi:MAG: hypothetical protein ACK417_07305 [Bacteroidia bacterium]